MTKRAVNGRKRRNGKAEACVSVGADQRKCEAAMARSAGIAGRYPAPPSSGIATAKRPAQVSGALARWRGSVAVLARPRPDQGVGLGLFVVEDAALDRTLQLPTSPLNL